MPLEVVVVGRAHHAPEEQAPAQASAVNLAQAPANSELPKPDLQKLSGLPTGHSPAEIEPQRAPLTQERFNVLSGELDSLLLAQKAQQKQLADLTGALEGLRKQLKKSDAGYANQEDLRRLIDATRQLDQARSKDDEEFRTELANLGKMLTSRPPDTASPTPDQSPASDASAAPTKRQEYIIKLGDTLSGISRAYRESNTIVSVDQLLKANPGLKPERLRPGQKIFIPVTPKSASEPSASGSAN